MRTVHALIPVLALCACPQPSTPPPPSQLPTDTGEPLFRDEGSLMLVRSYDGQALERAQLTGVFATSTQDIVNAAACLVDPLTPCLRELPGLGERLVFDPTQRFDISRSAYRYVGLEVRMGRFEAPYTLDGRLAYYDGGSFGPDSNATSVLVELGVEWGDHTVEVPLPEPLLVTFPRSTQQTVLAYSDDPIVPLTWEPAGADELYVIVQPDDPFLPGWIERAPDDGRLDLDLSDFGATEPTAYRVTLARWARAVREVGDHTLVTVNTAEARYRVEYTPVGDRAPITPAPSCDGGPPLLPVGGFYGSLGGYPNTIEAIECLQSEEPAAGRDGFFTLEVPPRQRSTVRFRQLTTNGALYLLDACADGDACVLAADLGAGLQAETIEVFNPNAEVPLTYLLAIDSPMAGTGGLFFLDHTRQPLPDPGPADSCAATAPFVRDGEYYIGDVDLYTNALNPGFQGCTGSGLPGPDNLYRLRIPPGVTAEVEVVMAGGDPALYLLDACGDFSTCLAATDIDGETETLTRFNASAEPAEHLLVVDTPDALLPYFLTIRYY